MKKLLTILLVLSMAFTVVPVSAANKDDSSALSTIDNLNFDPNTGALSGDSRASLMEVRYQAYQLHYEILDPQGTMIQSGNLGDLVTSTPTNIIDNSANGSYIKIPFFHALVIYPEGSKGFVMNQGQLYFAQARFSNTDNNGWLMMQADANGSTPIVESMNFTGTGSNLYTAAYNTTYRLRVTNIDTMGRDAYLYGLNFVQYVN